MSEIEYGTRTVVLLGTLSEEERKWMDNFYPGRTIQQVRAGEHSTSTSRWLKSLVAIPESELILVINGAKAAVLVPALATIFEEIGYADGYDAPRMVDLQVIEITSLGPLIWESRLNYSDYS